MNYINGEGSANAQLMIVGEAPGAHEDELGRPFIGPAGQLLNQMLSNCGIAREDCYVTNVVKIRPPNNDLKRLKELGKSIEDFLPALENEIQTIAPNCILALGNTALRYLTGKDKIQKWRGSILQSKWGYPKVIPTIHPAALIQRKGEGASDWRQKVFIEFDIHRAIAQSKFHDIRLPQRNLYILKNSLDVYRYLDRHRDYKRVALDVETFKTLPLCIGLSFGATEGVSIPLFNHISAHNPHGISTEDQVEIWRQLAIFLDSGVEVVGQNFKFDQRILEDVGFRIKGKIWDIMLKWAVCYPELPKKLQVISSICTEEPYYKDEGKEYNPKKDDISRLYLYNAKDAAITFECDEVLEQDLDDFGVRDFYENYEMPLHQFYYDMESEGIKIDTDVQKMLQCKYKMFDEVNDLELCEILNHPINVQSPKQVSLVVYHELKCPIRYHMTNGHQVLSADEDTLNGLVLNALKGDKNIVKREIIKKILYGRKLKKTIGTYIGAETGMGSWQPESDGRMHTSYFICGTETGRTSTSKREPPVSIGKVGLPFQTITKHGDEGSDIRGMFISDPGYIFLEADLSQAEARVVSLLANDFKSLEIFEKWRTSTDKDKYDIHRITASWIFNCAPEDISKVQRQLGKACRHAGNYDMGKRRLSQLANVSEWRAGQILEKFHEVSPGIRQIFHVGVQDAIAETRMLCNPFGRKRIFYDRISTDLFKEAYSTIPQGTVSDHLKFSAIRIKSRMDYIRILQESHDSFLAEVPKERLADATEGIRDELERPINFERCSLKRGEIIIPAEFKIGYNWLDMKDYTNSDEGMINDVASGIIR